MAKCRTPRARLWLNIDKILVSSRAQFGAARMEGEGDAAADAAAASAAADATAASAAAAVRANGENGFPPNTPVAEMTPEQRTAYNEFMTEKNRREWLKRTVGISLEDLPGLKEKASKHDALERELMSDKDKAVAEAADKAKSDTLAAVTPKLVRAEFKAALTGRVPVEELEQRLTTTVDALDLSKFLTATGDVDTAKVTAFVDTVAPATGTGGQRRGPTATRHGSGSGSGSGSTALTGRELFEQRHKKTPTSA